MKERVRLRDSTMRTKSHWLEIDQEGNHYFVSLRNDKEILGQHRTPIDKVVLENLVHVLPGVIIKNGPIRFYRTEEDVRVSFTEDEAEEGLSGYDRIEYDEFAKAIRKVIGEEEPAHEPRKHAKSPSGGKAK